MPTTTVAELSRVDEWLLSILLGDAALSSIVEQRVYADQAPELDTALPADSVMVVYSFLGGADKVVTSTARLSNSLYLIRAMAQGSSYSLVASAADRIEAVITVPQQGQIVRDVRITSAAREQPHQRKDAENGIPYVYMGGIYRIRFQPASQ